MRHVRFCIERNCSKLATYGTKESRRSIFCVAHAPLDTVRFSGICIANIAAQNARAQRCTTKASFGDRVYRQRIYCRAHKHLMLQPIQLVRFCRILGCDAVATVHAAFCHEHRPPRLIPI